MESFPHFDLFPKLTKVGRFIGNLLSIKTTPLMEPQHYEHPLDTPVAPVTHLRLHYDQPEYGFGFTDKPTSVDKVV